MSWDSREDIVQMKFRIQSEQLRAAPMPRKFPQLKTVYNLVFRHPAAILNIKDILCSIS